MAAPRRRTPTPKPTGRTTYTDEQKTAALAVYVEHGPAEAERQTSIPRRTISSWARRTGVQTEAPEKTKAAVEAAALTIEQRKQALAGRLLTEAAALLDQLHAPTVHREIVKLPGRIVAEFDDAGEPIYSSAWTVAEVHRPGPTTGEVKTLMIAAAIAVDKVQVLTGGATHRVAFEGEADAEVKGVAAEIISLASRRTG